MKIGLADVDLQLSNLCLMKLSEYHTRRGDWVEWWNPKGRYDLVYKSRVLTDTNPKDTIEVNNAEQGPSRPHWWMAGAAKTSRMRSNTSGRTTFYIRGFWERPTAF